MIRADPRFDPDKPWRGALGLNRNRSCRGLRVKRNNVRAT